MEVTESSVDPLNEAHSSVLTDDNSVLVSDQSINLNYSDEAKETVVEKENPQDIETEKDVIPRNVTESDTVIPMETDEQASDTKVSVENIASGNDIKKGAITVFKDIDVVDSITVKSPDLDLLEKPESILNTSPIEAAKYKVEESGISKDNKQINVDNEVKDDSSQKKNEGTKTDENIEIDTDKPATRIRKRTKSTTSNKSGVEADVTENKEEKEIKTPLRRKRTPSTASNKSLLETEQKTPENIPEDISTPSRRRAKTPTSAEVRKIITRRVSREMSGQLDQSKDNIETVSSTPKRRTTRARSKNIDDNESVASESSLKSSRSVVNEEAGDVKPAAIRKGRRSILATKTDLSVIPETIPEESVGKTNEDLINEYSSSRRLTRNQKAVLESWLEPAPSPRRASTSTAVSDVSRDDEDGSPNKSAAFDVQSMDRISLLNKADFEGSPDRDELVPDSPTSISTDASKERRSRLARATSESKQVTRAAKISRRIQSVDVAVTPEHGSPAPGASSPGRSRRASFHRACEALHTPKGRRTSTDVKGETDSPQGSEAAIETKTITPARRPRRVSTQSNTSQAASETSKRSKKTSAVEESKDSKK
ncbi:muscle M-line assembly protein unc-89-like [Achroia grisella]|uniref:muscle M-line assembly protein unc-89-like n=1 Tax=Achroia grisella TaxID=688607 RepID=UPI0027D2EAF3|nr:muscle M-line assembly protein unc-89-like [Achroia grisella]